MLALRALTLRAPALLVLANPALGNASAGAAALDTTSALGPPAAAAAPIAAAADTLRTRRGLFVAQTPLDLELLVGRRSQDLDRRVLTLTHRTFPASYRRSMLREVQADRFEAGLVWADRGAFAGAALGFLGTQTGVLSERNSWLLMGAGAALGALWGGLRPAEERRFHIRIEPSRWEPAEMLRYDPRERDP